jgi:hypothetical protein
MERRSLREIKSRGLVTAEDGDGAMGAGLSPQRHRDAEKDAEKAEGMKVKNLRTRRKLRHEWAVTAMFRRTNDFM